MKANRAAFLATLIVAACGPHLPPSKRYPGPWSDAPNFGIEKALGSHGVSGCGEYVYRAAFDNAAHSGLSNAEEYLVYCRTDGPVTAYVVFVRPGQDGDVSGPAQPDPQIPMPQFCCTGDAFSAPKAGVRP